VLFELASHHLDLARYFFEQEVKEVFAEIQSRHSEDDTATLQMRLDDGVIVQSFFSTGSVEEDSFEIYGEQGKLSVNRYLSMDVRVTRQTLDGFRLAQARHGLRSLARAPYLFEKIGAPVHEPSYRRALLRFLSAVRSGEHQAPDFLDGFHNLTTIEAAERSAATGLSVRVAESSAQSPLESIL
jgi:predicted dehydrogenase